MRQQLLCLGNSDSGRVTAHLRVSSRLKTSFCTIYIPTSFWKRTDHPNLTPDYRSDLLIFVIPKDGYEERELAAT